TFIIFPVSLFSSCAVAGLAELFAVEELTVLRAASGLVEVGSSIAVADEAVLLSNLTRLRFVSREGLLQSKEPWNLEKFSMVEPF
ncbi:MAG: hypothetical protein RIS64_884, partial [Bacteroidota bacterium]